MAFAPDGRTLALTVAQSVRLVDPLSGREFATLAVENSREITSLCFSRGGRWLAAAGGSDLLRVWDLLALRRHLAHMGLDWEAPPLVAVAEPEVVVSEMPAAVSQRGAERLSKIPRDAP